ncbi:hypothetical protein [Zophobihabitans entericus]|uniref:Uncharacterized protein n=1 Tax=Zophobihabitans entericus TaxID=1635327 RepID=A0A6G9ICF4_9GAMM|nr:hypothetical protein [Zophobihabitans entericus]QIQ21499.1 hypothetical protein IPMB12_07275 [Zophobihabitans entericus]
MKNSTFKVSGQTLYDAFINKKQLLKTSLFSRLFSIIVLSFISLLSINRTNAESLTLTSEVIQGNKPYLKLSDGTELTSLNQLSGFSMPNRDGTPGTEQIDVSMAGTVLIAPVGMKFSDITAIVSTTGASELLSSTTQLSVDDDDGDAGILDTILGTAKVEWKNNGVTVPLSAQNQIMPKCEGPYTLEITIDGEVSANTMYGYPRTNNYGTNPTITYTFTPAGGPEICYIGTGEMSQFYTGTSDNLKYTIGYNPALWEKTGNVHRGFSVKALNQAAVAYPTTGFDKAVLKLMGSGTDQNNYRCTKGAGASWVDLSGSASTALGENCQITYNSTAKPTTAATINMDYTVDGGLTWIPMNSYTIPVPMKWAIGKGLLQYGNTGSVSTSTAFPVLDACRTVGPNADNGTTTPSDMGMTEANKEFRQQYLYRRDELTNSPRTVAAEGSAPPLGQDYYSRDADGTFMGEWGRVANYAGSPWSGTIGYWASEAWSTVNQNVVSTDGKSDYSHPFKSYAAICRG